MNFQKAVSMPLVFGGGIALVGASVLLSSAAAKKGVHKQDIQIVVSSTVPTVISPSGTKPTLTEAGAFAWKEFIALNWPAVVQKGELNQRDTPDNTQSFGTNTDGPLVWHTYRSKVEIFPGQGLPNGYNPGSTLVGNGYDVLPNYKYGATVLPPVLPGTTPWINLDENNEIGFNIMFAGNAPKTGAAGQQVLFLAKANRKEYDYVVPKNWYDGTTIASVAQSTVAYQQKNKNSPPAGSSQYVSFPYGTIEVKSAWRQLTDAEAASGRFYTTKVRYYTKTDKPNQYQAVDVLPRKKDAAPSSKKEPAPFGMVALHIIHKIPEAGLFVFATFEQADNILDANGKPVEDVNGKPVPNPTTLHTQPLDSNITSKNATGHSYQSLSPTTSNATPGSRLYYKNSATSGLPQGIIAINRREHSIPGDIINVNAIAHAAIKSYFQAHNIPTAPWLYYKLVNVQAFPLDKKPGTDYTGADTATYYQANSVVESDYNLQTFSGHIVNSSLLISDYQLDNGKPYPPKSGNAVGTFYNVYNKGHQYLMGGCMGCHGNVQGLGFDFSFILQGQRVQSPDTVGELDPQKVQAKLSRLLSTK